MYVCVRVAEIYFQSHGDILEFLRQATAKYRIIDVNDVIGEKVDNLSLMGLVPRPQSSAWPHHVSSPPSPVFGRTGLGGGEEL